MPVMPDLTSYGARPIASSTRDMVSMGSRPEFSAISKIGNQIADIGVSMKSDADDYDYAQAKSLLLRDKERLQREALQQSDFTKYQSTFEGGFSQTRQKARSLIQNPERQKLFDLEADGMQESVITNLRNKAFEKEKDYGQANLLSTLDGNLRAGVEASDEITSSEFITTSYKAIDGAVAKGYIDPLDAVKQKMEFRKKFANFKLQGMAPEDAKALLTGDTSKVEEITKTISDKARKYGFSEEFLIKTAGIESGFNPSARNRESGATGLYQFMPKTAMQYGLVDPNDAEASIEAVIKLANDNQRALSSKIGRTPTDAELYLAHQQGATGASALLNNPDQNVVETLSNIYGNTEQARLAVAQNGGDINMTSREFANMWIDKYNSFQVTPDDIGVFQKKDNWTDFADYSVKKSILKQSTEKIEQKKLKAEVQAITDSITNQFPDDFENQFNATQAIEDPEKREMALDTIVKLHKIKKEFETQKTEAKYTTILTAIEQGSTEDIAPEVLATLSPRDKENLHKIVRKDAMRASFPIDSEQAREERVFYNKIQTEYEINPSLITSYSPLELKANLPVDRVEEFLSKRQEVINKKGEIKLSASEEAISNIYKDTLKQLDIPTGKDINPEDAKVAADLRDRLMVSIEDFKIINKKAPNYKELMDIRDQLISEVTIQKNRLFSDDVIYGFQIPNDERAKIIQALSSNGYTPSEELIIETYKRKYE